MAPVSTTAVRAVRAQLQYIAQLQYVAEFTDSCQSCQRIGTSGVRSSSMGDIPVMGNTSGVVGVFCEVLQRRGTPIDMLLLQCGT